MIMKHFSLIFPINMKRIARGSRTKPLEQDTVYFTTKSSPGYKAADGIASRVDFSLPINFG